MNYSIRDLSVIMTFGCVALFNVCIYVNIVYNMYVYVNIVYMYVQTHLAVAPMIATFSFNRSLPNPYCS